MHPNWVEHLMSLEPVKSKGKYAHKGPDATENPYDSNWDLKPTCKCGRPKPCEVHDLKVDITKSEPVLLCGLCRVNHRGYACPKAVVESMCESCGKFPPANGGYLCAACNKVNRDLIEADKKARAARTAARAAARAAQPSLKEMMNAQ